MESVKQVLETTFIDNAVRDGKNPRSVYLAASTAEEVDQLTAEAVRALEALGRRSHVVDAAGLTEMQLFQAIAPGKARTTYEAFKHVRELLHHQDVVLLLKNVSRTKTRPDKGLLARSFIKELDDAHFSGIRPKAELVFIDRARFLEEQRGKIEHYLVKHHYATAAQRE